jgi:hypothetical protein
MMMKRIYLVIAISLSIIISSIKAYPLPEYSDLYSMLVDIKGWEADSPAGSHLSGSMGEMVKVERHYKKDRKRIDIMIIGGAPADSIWMPFQMDMAYEGEEAFLKTTTLKGFKAGISHNRKDSTGSVVVLVKEITEGSGAVFVLDYANMEFNEALKIVELFPLNKIKSRFE